LLSVQSIVYFVLEIIIFQFRRSYFGNMLSRLLDELREKEPIHLNRIFRGRTQPLEKYNDLEIYNKYRCDRASIIELTDALKEDLPFLTKEIILILQLCRYWTHIVLCIKQFPRGCGGNIGRKSSIRFENSDAYRSQ
jgi:hypothetical protein